jgi:hypothetical protein
MVVQGLGCCLKVVSERHGHVSAPVSVADQTPQGRAVRLRDIECLDHNVSASKDECLLIIPRIWEEAQLGFDGNAQDSLAVVQPAHDDKPHVYPRTAQSAAPRMARSALGLR